MTYYANRRSFTEIFTLTSGLLIFILSSSLTYNEILPFESRSEQIKSSGASEFIYEFSFTPFNSAHPYFPLIYTGHGVDHMNINLVNLASTGLIAGDEVGVFDGIYCVGSEVIKAKNISENSLSIPASANENSETKPNGYIEGHKITIKTYRAGIVYLLYFETVNNSTDTFEKGSSMFALVDFSRSEKQTAPEGSFETIKIYPNPFDTNMRIEVNLPKVMQLNCEIFDINGKLIKTLYDGLAEGQQLLVWDGKDNNMNQVSVGVYFCRVNNSTTKIIYGK